MDSEFQKEDDYLRQKELETADWQRNLKIAWIGTFFTGASFSIVMPFMALYVEELGVKGTMVNGMLVYLLPYLLQLQPWFHQFGDTWRTVMVESP